MRSDLDLCLFLSFSSKTGIYLGLIICVVLCGPRCCWFLNHFILITMRSKRVPPPLWSISFPHLSQMLKTDVVATVKQLANVSWAPEICLVGWEQITSFGKRALNPKHATSGMVGGSPPPGCGFICSAGWTLLHSNALKPSSILRAGAPKPNVVFWSLPSARHIDSCFLK